MKFSIDELDHLSSVLEGFDPDKAWHKCYNSYLPRECYKRGCVIWTHAYKDTIYHRHEQEEYILKFHYNGIFHSGSETDKMIEEWVELFHNK